MWYLIVPPIVVVVSLAFFLWYLSRKSADPDIALRVSHLEQSEAPVSFSRTKTFFLKTLEKTMQRSKVISLRMHNVLNDRLQSVRHRRQEIAESVANQQEEVVEEVVPPVVDSSVVPRVVLHEDVLAAPIVRQRRAADEGHVFHAERPMVSETAAEPEVKKRHSTRDDSREADLIGSIAADPKNFIAYESLGDYYLEAGNVKDAKECYRQVLRLSPTHRMVKIKIRRLEKLLTRDGE
jgi:tetratricopeptide (TPR) repeat protein